MGDNPLILTTLHVHSLSATYIEECAASQPSEICVAEIPQYIIGRCELSIIVSMLGGDVTHACHSVSMAVATATIVLFIAICVALNVAGLRCYYL